MRGRPFAWRIACALALTSPPLSAQPDAAPPAAEAAAEALTPGQQLVRRAEAHLDELARAGLDTTALIGIATPPTRARVASGAGEALRASRAAADALRAEIRAVEQSEGYPRDESLRAQRTELAVEFLEYRHSFALARAALLAAAVADDAAAAERFAAVARDALHELDARAPDLRARRDVIVGLAQLALGEPEAAAALEGAEAAARDAGAPALERTVVEAAIGRALALAREGDHEGAQRALSGASGKAPLAQADGSTAPTWRVTLADAAARLAGAAASDARSRAARGEAHRRAERAYVDLLRAGVPGVGPASLRSLVYEKLRTIAARLDTPPAGLPPLFVIAEAVRMAGQDETLDSAADLARRALRSGGYGDAAPEILWEAGRILLAHAAAPRTNTGEALTGRRAALQALTRLAGDWPSWPQSLEAVRAACGAGAALRRAGALEDAESSDAYRAALRMALERLPDAERHRWRVELAHALGLDHPDVGEALAAVPSGDEMAPFARTLQAARAHRVLRSASSEAAERRARTLLERIDAARRAIDQAADRAGNRLARPLDLFEVEARLAVGDLDAATQTALDMGDDDPLAIAALAAAREALRGRLDELILADDQDETARIGEMLRQVCARTRQVAPQTPVKDDLAWATLAAGEPGEALDLFESLASERGRRESILRGLALATWRAGDAAGAFGIYRDIVTALEARGVRSDLFWTAWSRMLQILKEQNEDGARTDAIRRGIARLRAVDPSLGGSPFRERIEAVEAALPGAEASAGAGR